MDLVRKYAAYHEAAHAVADVQFGHGLIEVSIRRIGTHAGNVTCEVDWPWGREQMRTFIVSLLCGYSAEIAAAAREEDARASAAQDFERASMHVDQLREGALDDWVRKSDRFVAAHWDEVEAVALALLARETLDGHAVEAVIHTVERPRNA